MRARSWAQARREGFGGRAEASEGASPQVLWWQGRGDRRPLPGGLGGPRPIRADRDDLGPEALMRGVDLPRISGQVGAALQ
jgi:hypothetical protein